MKPLFFLLITLFLTTSCVSKNLKYKYMEKLPAVKNNEDKVVAVVLNTEFEDPGVFFWDNDVYDIVKFKQIIKKIKGDLEENLSVQTVYYHDLKPYEIEELKQKYSKVVVFDMKVSKTLSFTVLYDYVSLFLPYPAPQWGAYRFKTDIKFLQKDKKEVKFTYDITSDFSYILFPMYRTDAQITAVERAIDKFMKEVINNEELISLFSKNSENNFNNTYFYVLEEKGTRVIQRDDNYSRFPISIDVRALYGESRINGYYEKDGKDELGASGMGELREIKIQASTYRPVTNYYISPTVGYYYQEVDIADFGYDPTYFNLGREGYIPGRVEERDKDGNVVTDSNPYTVEYSTQFSSAYLGGKFGLNLILGDKLRFIFSPMFYFSLIEARHTVIKAGENEFSDWSFPFLGMIGFNFETGLFFKELGVGFKFGFDTASFKKFDIGHKIKFNTVIIDENYIMRGKLIEISRYSAYSYRAFFDVFFIF